MGPSLVAYPVLLVGLMLISVWFHQRGVTTARLGLARRLFWLLFLTFIAGVCVSLLLMLNA